MPITDNRTPNLNLPLPAADNQLQDDVLRLIAALTGLDTAVFGKADLVAGKVPASQLPSFVDDVLEYANLAAFPATGETGKIYVAIDTGKVYRWGGSAYIVISDFVLLQATPTQLGGVKVGSGLGITPDGVLYVVGGGGGSGLPVYADSVLTPSTAGQTTFAVPGGYNPGQLDVWFNGSKLIGNGDDYTATDGVNIVLTEGISSPSKLEVRKWIYLPESMAVNKTGDTMTGALNWAAAVSVASAATVNIGVAASNLVSITGTTTITSLGSVAAGVWRKVVFGGALTLTHNATSLILPGGANITTAAGDVAEFTSLGGGNWRCDFYQRASWRVPSADTANIALRFGSVVNHGGVSFNAVAGTHYFVWSGGITCTLPASPAVGDTIWFTSYAAGWVISRNGKPIQGIAQDMTIDLGGYGVDIFTFGLRFIEDGAATGWVIIFG